MSSRYMSRLSVICHLPPLLEADVLESLGSRAVQLGRPLVIAPARCEVAACDPGGRAVAPRAELAEARLCGGEGRLRLVEPALLEQGVPEHELGAADLVDVVDATVEQLECLARLLLGQLDVARAQMDLRERRNGAAGVGVAPEVEGDRERLLEQLHGLVGVAEQEVETAEVVRELADVNPIRELAVGLPRLLGVVARQHPVALAVGDEGSLEVRGPDRAEILDPLGQLESALDVVAGRLEVALALPAARAPREDVRLERVARQAGTLGQRERFVEERERRLHAGELVAAAAEPEEDVGPLDVGERLRLRDRARLVEQLDGGTVLADAHLREPAAAERTHLQLGHARRTGCADERLEGLHGLDVLLGLVQRLGTREGPFEAGALVRRDPAREEAGVDSQPVGEPLDRPGGRPRLAALDLRDVLLGEAVAGELALRQPGGDAELAETLPEAKTLGTRLAGGAAGGLSHGVIRRAVVKRILH